MLSCSCECDGDDWWYYQEEDFQIFNRKKRKRCCSCNKLIDIGSDCVRFERFRSPYNEIEERIWGDDVQLANWYMCFDCGGLYLTFQSLGYCHYLGTSIREDLEDYWDLTGFTPNKKE